MDVQADGFAQEVIGDDLCIEYLGVFNWTPYTVREEKPQGFLRVFVRAGEYGLEHDVLHDVQGLALGCVFPGLAADVSAKKTGKR
jgi:hypothetical protein